MKLSKIHTKGRQRSEDETVKIDYSKTPSEILKEILTAINSPSISSQRKLTYYNIFVKFYFRERFAVETSLTKLQILVCLQVGLFSKVKELRAATLRALRYFCSDIEVVQSFFSLHLHYFVVRSLDLCLNNEVERTNALRLIRRIISVVLPVPSDDGCQSPSSSSFDASFPSSSPREHLPSIGSKDPELKSPRKTHPPHGTGVRPTSSPSSSFGSSGILPVPRTSFVSLLNSVVSVANDGFIVKDKLFNVCLSTICELVIQDPYLASQIGGVSCLLRNVPQFHGHPRINEALVATILNVFNFPSTRPLIRVNMDLEQMLVPFTDLEYKVSLEMRGRFDAGSDVKYGACKLALGTILRSWSGIFYLCSSSSRGLQSLFSMLGLSNMETRKEILDVFYDVFRFSVPEWTDDFNAALKSIAALPKTMDLWKLVNGFVAEEAKSILPHLNLSRLNLIDNHMSFILCCFINQGILEAVTEAVISSDKHVCVRATILLGELLHLTSILLPESYNRDNHCLPRLVNTIMSSTVTNPSLRMQCNDALNCLLRIENSKRIPPIELSNQFLQHQIQCCFNAGRIHRSATCAETADTFRSDDRHRSTYHAKKDSSAERESGESLPQLLKDSHVLYTVDSKSWDWFVVLTILKFPEESLEIADDIMAQRFLERLVHVFKPSGRIYSMMKISDDESQEMTLIAFHLVDYLLNSPDQATTSLLFSFLQDINSHLVKVIERSNISESLMNPSSLISSCSQTYFLVIGRLSSVKKGNHLLGTSKIYDSFSLVASSASSSDVIIKLVVSSLDYSNSSEGRKILREALVSTSEKASRFCTSFLRIPMRCRLPMFAEWCIPLLVAQMRNQSMAVATEALSVLLEAAEDEEYLRVMANLRHELRQLGFKSDSLAARFLSLPDIFRELANDGTLEREMDKWRRQNNLEFVEVVEERLVESMTTYERTYNCSYARRTSRKYARKDVLVPIHIYGQLVQHDEGIEYLRGEEQLRQYFETVRRADTCTKESLKATKAALWVVGHVGSTEGGLKILLEKDVIGHVVRAAETNPVLTLRGTAFYVLSMLSSTRPGSDELMKHNWTSVRVDKVDPSYVGPTCRSPFARAQPLMKERKLHSTVDFMTEISEVATEPPRTGDPSQVSRLSHSMSGEGLNSTGKDRRQSMLTSLINKLKPKPHKNPESHSKAHPDSETSDLPKIPRKKTKSQTSSASSETAEVKATVEMRGDRSATGRRLSEVFPEDPHGAKIPFGSAQSSCSSVGKMSTSVCSEDNQFSNSSVFLSAEDKPTKSHQEGEEEVRSVRAERLTTSTSARVGTAPNQQNKIVPGFLSDPDILRTKTVQPSHVWMTVGDVSERHKKTKSLDYRSTPKNINFRHSLRDKIKSIRGIRSHGDHDSQKHPYGVSTARAFDAPFVSSNEMRLQRTATHFISISLPVKMEQVFQSLKAQVEDDPPSLSQRDISMSLRKEFFKQPVPEEKISNKEAFSRLFDGLDEHKVDVCFVCTKKAEGHRSVPSPSAPKTSHSASISSISEDSPEGQNLVRKELLRLMLQLSCTVGSKSVEQGMLLMKQRFPESFRSLCLYSDVSHMLSICSFRLESRRFIQELFLDLNFQECHSDVKTILNISEWSAPTNNRRRKSSTSSSNMPDDFKSPFSDFDYTFDRSEVGS